MEEISKVIDPNKFSLILTYKFLVTFTSYWMYVL
jgi:hypothetical protein